MSSNDEPTPIACYGVAEPLPLNKVEPGMVLVAADHLGKRLMGVAVEDDHGALFAVIWSEGDLTPPYVIEPSDAHTTLGVIKGNLEVEPLEAFQPLGDRNLRSEGLFITANGDLGLAVGVPSYSRENQRRHFSVATGKKLTANGGAHAALGPTRAFIRYSGRTDRLLLTPKDV